MLGRGSGQRDPPFGKIVKTLAAGVGLASETYQHQKNKRALKNQQDNEEGHEPEELQPTSVAAETTQAEQIWQLDELQEEVIQQDGLPGSSNVAVSRFDPSVLADNFIQTHQPPPYLGLQEGSALVPPLMPMRLELPVIITQRRPKDRTRGFIRAYAPILEDVGIEQQAFLDFLDQLNKAVQPSPWIQAINLAAFAAQHVPEPVTLAVSIACKMVADAASTTHSRFKTNSFLDKVNEEYFLAKGLVALLVTWKPNDSSIVTNLSGGADMGSTISSAASSSFSQGLSRMKHCMQSSSGASHFEFPATAPLIFPTLDAELTRTSSDTTDGTPESKVKKRSVLQRGGVFLADYQDRRAVAEWAGKNPESKVANAAPMPEFRSRYSDPNHPASSGDLVAFVTGGKVSGLGGLRASRMAGTRERVPMYRGSSSTRPIGIGGVVQGVKGLLQSDILYLLIVNRPSEHEIDEAVALVYGNEENQSHGNS